MNLDHTECTIVALALAMINGSSRLSRAETEIACAADGSQIRDEARCATADGIRRGDDPLGKHLYSVRNGAGNRTSPGVADVMRWWIAGLCNPARFTILDSGTGQLLIPLAQALPQSSFVAIEHDPLAALVLRANLVAMKLHRRTRIVCGCEEMVRLPHGIGPVAYLGYSDHKSEVDKSLARMLDAIAMLARPGDTATFVLPSDALELKGRTDLLWRIIEAVDVTRILFLEPKASGQERMTLIDACNGIQADTIQMGFSRFPTGTAKPSANAWLNVPRSWLQDGSSWSDIWNRHFYDQARPDVVRVPVSLPG